VFRQSILDCPIQRRRYGVDVVDDDTDAIRSQVEGLIHKDLKLSFIKYASRSFRDPRNWWVTMQWRRWMAERNFDVVHYNGTSMLFFQQNLLDKKSRKVFTVHDHVQHLGEYSRQATWYLKYIAKGSRMHRFIAQSDFVREGFMKEYGVSPDRVTTIRYGTLDLYKKWEDPSVVEEPNTVLFFGRISPYKGLEYLAEAWKTIRVSNPKARLIIAGGGDFYFDVRDLATDQRVELCNTYIDNAELVRFIQRASVVVLPYVEATQSGVVMTAYAFGKPVVATSVGALPEVVEHNVTGLLVPPQDPIALAHAVGDLLDKPGKRTAMSASIKRKASTDFAWENIAEQTLQVYRTCLGW
jgi:glycosyltransferase involved in cell wall biosynthesis